MYYPFFIVYMLIGFILSVVVFLWALNAGQFRDQKRARFLPLERDSKTEKVEGSGIRRIEVYALMFLACTGLAASAAVLIFALMRGS